MKRKSERTRVILVGNVFLKLTFRE